VIILPRGAEYFIIPGWAYWVAGLGPFAGVLIARRFRLRPLWWISLTCVFQFFCLTIAWDVFIRDWRAVIASGIIVTVTAAFAVVARIADTRSRKRRAADLTSKKSCINIGTEDDGLGSA
jgi:hypothetical protein